MLNGCASQTLKLPDCDVKEASVEIQELRRLPAISDPVITETSATYTADQFRELTRYVIVAGGNYDAGNNNTEALISQSKAYNELIGCSKFQHKFSEVREQQLEQERKDHFIDNLWHRGLIVLIGVGVAL